MSEYRYYEFQAVDRPLTKEQMAELRAISTRAKISPNQLVNVYHYGDFRGDPEKLMERYFDGHVYLANWGTRKIMLRVPRGLLDLKTADRYCPDEWATARAAGEYVILAYRSEEEGGGGWAEEPEGVLSAILRVRDELGSVCNPRIRWRYEPTRTDGRAMGAAGAPAPPAEAADGTAEP